MLVLVDAKVTQRVPRGGGSAVRRRRGHEILLGRREDSGSVGARYHVVEPLPVMQRPTHLDRLGVGGRELQGVVNVRETNIELLREVGLGGSNETRSAERQPRPFDDWLRPVLVDQLDLR